MIQQQRSPNCFYVLRSIHKRSNPLKSAFELYRPGRGILCWFVKGRGSLRIGQSEHKVAPDQVYFIGPDADAHVSLRLVQAEYYLVFMEAVKLVEAGGAWTAVKADSREAFPFPEGRVWVSSARRMAGQLAQLYAWSRSRPKGDDLQPGFHEWVMQAARSMAVPPEGERGAQGMEASIGYLQDHYREKLSLGMLADMAGFTQSSYSREFKRRTGMSPIAYMNDLRIRCAKQLLEEQRTVKEAAASAGFGNEFYFSRLFKRTVGVAPAVYMKRCEIRVAVISCVRYQDNLRSLQLEPVFTADWYNYKGVAEDKHRQRIARSLNQLRQAKPDLIICDHNHAPYVEVLQNIAPAVALELKMDWRSMHRQIAELTGREREAERNCAETEGHALHTRQLLAAAMQERTVAVMRIMHNQVRLQGVSSHPFNDLLYRELGLKPAPCLPDNQMNVKYRLEDSPLLDTDCLFVQKQCVYPGDKQIFTALQQKPVWQTMKAVVDNEVYYTDNWVAFSWSPLGRSRIMEDLIKLRLSES